MAYQKKIAYLDYLENGMKIQNAGFLRIEENNGQTRLEMRVKNIPEQFVGEYEVNADIGGIVGRISLSRGSGCCCVVWKNGTAAPSGKKQVQANGIYIRLPGRHLVQTQWDAPTALLVEKGEEDVDDSAVRTSADVDNAVLLPSEDADDIAAPQAEMAIYPQWEVLMEPQMQISSEPEISGTGETEQHRAEVIASESEETPESEYMLQPGSRGIRPDIRSEAGDEAVCYGDKWEQLSHMYPAIHPFGDEREYLSIAPKDFVVLRHEYQKMVHNSFLLHGYYNYKHLILGKIAEKEEWRYYLGVPGNFYTREKMVAEMFGFEAFEGEKTPAQAGEFGYFMKRVEI